MLAGLLALTASSAFAGARGFAMQASLAMVSGILGLVAAWQTKDWRWLVGAALIPCQLALHTAWHHADEQQAKGLAPDAAGPTSRTMIETWGRLHAIRTGLGLAATLAYLWALD